MYERDKGRDPHFLSQDLVAALKASLPAENQVKALGTRKKSSDDLERM